MLVLLVKFNKKKWGQEQLVLDLLKKEVDGHFFIIFQKRTIRALLAV